MCAEVLFRSKERKDIREAIIGDTGNIVEVYGPPMVGKSVLIDQAIDDIQSMDISPDEHTIYHKFWCKNILVMQDLFIEIVQELSRSQLSTNANTDLATFYESSFILKLIKRIVTRFGQCRHIFVFHKCESFHINGTSFAFLSFLGEVINMFQSTQCKVHIVFSTYKRFSLSGHKTRQVNVGMLINPLDIICLLSHYAPGVDIDRYVYLCQRYLCLPKLIVQIAISYISKNIYTPKLLELLLTKDLRFYSEMFKTGHYEVCSWLTKHEMDLIALIYRAGFDLFYTDTLTDHDHRLYRAYLGLKYNLVIGDFDQSGQMIVHPFALYSCAKDYPVSTKDKVNTTNSYTHFIGQVLWKAETNLEKHGIKGETYGCHRQEWPVIRELCQAAICGDFTNILRVAVVARRLIMVLYPNEAKKFYSGLFETTQAYGSPREAAVMEACLGHVTASGAGVNFHLALEHLDSAIATLKHRGPTFFYKWTLRKKAIILHRVSRYPESLKYFTKAKSVKQQVLMSSMEQETFSVSDLQVDEDDIIGEIHETIPMIFSGDNERALRKLLTLNATIHDRYDHHPDYDVLLNNIGLAIQRGYKDLKNALKWYTRSLKQRSLLVRINPQIMLVTLNNVGMIKFRTGDIVGAEHDLQQAITILREGVWFQYNTALTLTHLAEIKLKMGKFQDAYDSLLKADEILKKIYKNNDYRIKVNLGLFHYKLLLEHKDVALSVKDLMTNDIERLVDLGFNINKNMSDDSHHQLMSVYEHGMVVNWGVSGDKVRAHMDMLLSHVDENSIVKDLLEKTDLLPGRPSLLFEHRYFLEYIKNTAFDDLQLEKLLGNLNLTCPTCRVINEILGQEMWLKDRLSPSCQRDALKDQSQQLEDFSSFSDISSKTFLSLEDLPFSKEKRKYMYKDSYFLKRRYNSKLAYIYHPGRNYQSRSKGHGIPDNKVNATNDFGPTLSGNGMIINPSYSFSCNLMQLKMSNAIDSTTCVVANPSTSLTATGFSTEGTSGENHSQNSSFKHCLVPYDQTDFRSLYALNPSKSVELKDSPSPIVKIVTLSPGKSKPLTWLVPGVSVSARNSPLLSPNVDNPLTSFGQNTSQSYTNAHLSILNPSSNGHISNEQDFLNPSIVGYHPWKQDLLNPSSVYNYCTCEQDVLNPSSVYVYRQAIVETLSETAVKLLECAPDVALHFGSSSFDLLPGLPELADRTDIACNAIDLYSFSSSFSYLDYFSSSPTYSRHVEEQIWVGSHLSEEHSYQSFPSNAVCIIGPDQDIGELYQHVEYTQSSEK